MPESSLATSTHETAPSPDQPVPVSRAAKVAARFGVLGGVVFFFDLGLHAFAPLGRSYFVLATAMALCLLGVPAAHWLRGGFPPGWRRRLAAVGTGLVVGGVAAWTVAFGLLFDDPDRAFSQKLTPGGSVLMALGMLLLGAAVLASHRRPLPHAAAALAVGLYFPAQLIAQLAFFLDGKDGEAGPNGPLLGVWGLVWAWAAWSSTPRAGRPARTASVAVTTDDRPRPMTDDR